jgi:hypothetical protein
VSRGAAVCHGLSAVLLVSLLGLVVATFGDYGIAPEEPFQNRYGNRLVRWYLTLGAHQAAADTAAGYEGGVFELVVQAAQRVSPLGVYETRHLVNALFGLVGVLASGWIGLQLAGPQGALLSMLFLATTPLFYGHAFNDPRNVPFASLFALGSALLLRLRLDRMPGPGWPVLARLLLAGAVIGLSAAVRVAGLTLLGFAALAWLLCVFEDRIGRALPNRPLWRDLGRIALDVAILGSTAWLSMVLFWPYAQLDPFAKPFEAFQALARPRGTDALLYEGALRAPGQLPRFATLRLFLMTLPEVYLLAAAMGLWRIVAVLRHTPLPWETWTKLRHFGWLLTVSLLPLLWTLVVPVSPGGHRHLLFVVPGLAALAGASAAWWLRSPLPLALRGAGLALLIALLGLTARDMAQLHPFEPAYYNRLLAGGVARAASHFETDDRGGAVREAVAWIVRAYPAEGREAPVRVSGGPGFPSTARHLLPPGEARRLFELVPPDAEPHLVLAPTATRKDEQTSGRVVHVVERQGFAFLKVFEVRPPPR